MTGQFAAYVWGAYAVTAVIVGAATLATLLRYRRARKQLDLVNAARAGHQRR